MRLLISLVFLLQSLRLLAGEIKEPIEALNANSFLIEQQNLNENSFQPSPTLESDLFGKAKKSNYRRSSGGRKMWIRVGFGHTIADSNLNALIGILKDFRSSWMVKTDLLYKIGGYGFNSIKTERFHTAGVFLQYGMQSASNISRMLGESGKVNTEKKSTGFMEAEAGFMFREQFRISGGGGMMNYFTRANQHDRATQFYYTFTTGLSVRVLPFLELDLNMGTIVINQQFRPRASASAVFLLKGR